MARSTTMRGLAVAGLTVVLALLAIVSSASSDRSGRPLIALGGSEGRGQDITNTAEGQKQIREAAGRFQAAGVATAIGDLAATRFDGGGVVVGPKGALIEDERSGGGGFRTTTTPGREKGVLLAGPMSAAAPYWSQIANSCLAYTLPSGSHFDPCYKMYKMINDNNSSKEYWRLDWKGTMFTAAGRTLDWGWLHADTDSGPLQTWADYSPTADSYLSSCQNQTLSVEVLGAGAAWTYLHCDKWDISKSTGTIMGYFKNQWSWGTSTPVKDLDRGVALEIASYGNNGAITYGISWNFAEH